MQIVAFYANPTQEKRLTDKEKALIESTDDFEKGCRYPMGFFITWENGSQSFHLVYEPHQHFVFEGMAVLLGHEEIVFVRGGQEVFRTFTR